MSEKLDKNNRKNADDNKVETIPKKEEKILAFWNENKIFESKRHGRTYYCRYYRHQWKVYGEVTLQQWSRVYAHRQTTERLGNFI